MQTIIKNNKIINILFFYAGSFVFRFIGLFIRVNNKRILFSSGMGKGIFDSPLVLYNEIKNDPFFKDYEIAWAVEDVEKYQSDFNVIKIDTLKYFLYCISSKVWITSVNIERGLKFKKKDTIYVNTWHGVPLKHIGLDVKSRNDYNFQHIDFFLSSGDYESRIYQKAFNLHKESIRNLGNPRNISLYNFSEDREQSKKNTLESLNLSHLSNKKIILFAPTWKDHHYEILDLDYLSKKLGNDYVILVKSHPLEKLEFKNSKIVDLSSISDISTLLPIVDILISDYSSVMIDFSIFLRPIISFSPDFEDYKSVRGLYVTKDKLAPNVFDDVESIYEFIIELNEVDERKKTIKYRDSFLEADPRIGMPILINELKDKIERGN